MRDIIWIELLLNVIFFLIASYFIFYKSWLKSLGNEIAKLSTRKQLTQIEENVKKDFNEKIESYKNKLSEELSLKIEPIKSELAKNNISHQIEYGYLHQERAKVIIELYKRLIALQSAMVNWTASIHPIIEDAEKEAKERNAKMNDSFGEFRDFYLNNKLFFPKSFCDTFDNLVEQYWSKAWDYDFKAKQIKSRSVTGEFYKQYSTEMSAIRDEFRNKIPEEIKDIEDKFREILKVID